MGQVSKAPEDELLELYYRSAPVVLEAMDDLMQEQAKLYLGGGDTRALRAAEAHLAETLTLVLNVSALIGIRRLMLEVDERRRKYGLPKQFAVGPHGEFVWPPAVPRAPFKESVEDLLKRNPRLAKGYMEVARIYTEERGFALARSSSAILTERIQKEIVKGMEEGEALEVRETIQRLGDFTAAYSQNVYRTNMASAYNLGRMVQAHDPDLEDFVVGFRSEAVMDVDTRDSHRLADGFMAAKDDPAWMKMAPPKDYQCRCTLVMVDQIEAERLGILRNGRIPRATIPPGAANAPGFTRTTLIGIGGG